MMADATLANFTKASISYCDLTMTEFAEANFTGTTSQKNKGKPHFINGWKLSAGKIVKGKG
jgi:uncharacterized protein YjbI with pentapeptide repeats